MCSISYDRVRDRPEQKAAHKSHHGNGVVALPQGYVPAESQPPNSKEKLARESVLHRKQPLLRVEAFCGVRAREHCKGVQSFLRVRLRPQQKAEQDSPCVGFS